MNECCLGIGTCLFFSFSCHVFFVLPIYSIFYIFTVFKAYVSQAKRAQTTPDKLFQCLVHVSFLKIFPLLTYDPLITHQENNTLLDLPEVLGSARLTRLTRTIFFFL